MWTSANDSFENHFEATCVTNDSIYTSFGFIYKYVSEILYPRGMCGMEP